MSGGSASGRKGAAWESELVAYLRECGFGHAERRAKMGMNDRGDVTGIRGVCIEAKNARRHELGPWLDETIREAARGPDDLPVLAVKRSGHGAHGAYAIVPMRAFAELLIRAGYD